MSNRVVHFEIHANDTEKIGKFYADVFGWQIEEWKMPGVQEENRYWGVMTAPRDSKEPGINGGIVVRKGSSPKDGEAVNAFVCTIQVPSVDEYLEKVKVHGGTVAVPKMPITDIAWLAYCKDIEGNIFGIYEDRKK